MKISDYIPKLYEFNIEMSNIINSEEKELETKLKPYIDKAFNDNFPIIASKDGIEKYEKILAIQLDENQDNLEYRRNQVITRLTTRPPLTYKWLENSLNDLIGKGNYEIKLNYEDYSLEVQVSNLYKSTAETIYNFYRPLIPANLDFIVDTIETHQGSMKLGGFVLEGEYITIKSEEEI